MNRRKFLTRSAKLVAAGAAVAVVGLPDLKPEPKKVKASDNLETVSLEIAGFGSNPCAEEPLYTEPVEYFSVTVSLKKDEALSGGWYINDKRIPDENIHYVEPGNYQVALPARYLS